MPFCNTCNCENPDNAKFCLNCGASFEAALLHSSIASSGYGTAVALQQAEVETEPTSESIVYRSEVTQKVESEQASPAQVQYGTLGSRLLAFICDVTVVYLILAGVYFFAELSSKPIPTDDDHATIVLILAFLAYMTLGQCFYHTTVGKYICELEIKSDGQRKQYPNIFQILLRESLGKWLSTLFWGYGFWSAAIDRRNRHGAIAPSAQWLQGELQKLH